MAWGSHKQRGSIYACCAKCRSRKEETSEKKTCSKILSPLHELYALFWGSQFFSPWCALKMWVVVRMCLRPEEYVSAWNCAWEGTADGNLVVSTAWGQKKGSTCETALKGSVTGKTYEAAFYGASRSSVKVPCICSTFKDKILLNKEAKAFKSPKNHWWEIITSLTELTHSWNSVTSY